MKRSNRQKVLASLFAGLILTLLAGCGSDQASGYDSASREAAEALAKNGNDISKLTPEQRAALENAAKASRPDGGTMSTNGGTGTPGR